MTSVFAQHTPQAWPYRYEGRIHCFTLAGGTPSDPNVAAGWLKSKIQDKDAHIAEMVAEIMTLRGIGADEAAEELDRLKHLNGFRRGTKADGDHFGHLFIEGRQLKAAVKEAASVARAAEKIDPKWGTTNKGVQGWFAEHAQIVENRLYLYDEDDNPVMEPSEVLQSFPKNARTGQTGIQQTEILKEVHFDFTLITDYDFAKRDADLWPKLWLTAEFQGIGASRSQGFGRYEMVKWEQVSAPAKGK